MLGSIGITLGSAQAPTVPVFLLILIGLVALLYLLRVIGLFVMTVWATKDALNNEGFARRYWSYHKSRRRKKGRHDRTGRG